MRRREATSRGSRLRRGDLRAFRRTKLRGGGSRTTTRPARLRRRWRWCPGHPGQRCGPAAARVLMTALCLRVPTGGASRGGASSWRLCRGSRAPCGSPARAAGRDRRAAAAKLSSNCIDSVTDRDSWVAPAKSFPGPQEGPSNFPGLRHDADVAFGDIVPSCDRKEGGRRVTSRAGARSMREGGRRRSGAAPSKRPAIGTTFAARSRVPGAADDRSFPGTGRTTPESRSRP